MLEQCHLTGSTAFPELAEGSFSQFDILSIINSFTVDFFSMLGYFLFPNFLGKHFQQRDMSIHIAVINVVSSHLASSACHHESFDHCSVSAWTLVPPTSRHSSFFILTSRELLTQRGVWGEGVVSYVPFRVMRACPEKVLPV